MALLRMMDNTHAGYRPINDSSAGFGPSITVNLTKSLDGSCPVPLARRTLNREILRTRTSKAMAMSMYVFPERPEAGLGSLKMHHS
jgi:hypothetical protein